LVLTNRATGPDSEKPAFWLDGNLHATELTASMAALYAANALLERYQVDSRATRILDDCAVYIAPRLNPDGAAQALSAQPRFLRSGTRPYPDTERRDGLHMEDIDGNGRILQMRIADPAGDWTPALEDPRLMIRRRPDEDGGEYYRVLPEGRIQNYDGHLIRLAPAYQGLDFNRNFPAAWRPEGQQRGAGDFPGSEPEIQAVLRFITGHPNIFGALTFHTYSRAILRPFGDKPDESMDTNDRWIFEAIGARGTEITGYPCVSVYHDFRYHPKEVITGVFDDWLYEHRGVFAYTVELWDLPTAAGIESKSKDKRFIEWFRTHPRDDDLLIARFVSEHAPTGLVAWQAFDHPELGPVEIGGWDSLMTWRNPPPALLEAEIAPMADFVLAFASLAPRLEWRALEAEPLGRGYLIRAVVENTGFLGTYGSNQAKTAQVVQPVRASIELPEGVRMVGGTPSLELGHLEGRSNKLSTAYYVPSPTDHRAKAEWVVEAPAGTTVSVSITSQRGGTLLRSLTLGSA
jgi:murein tripeptide amidase MpaA